MTLHKQWARPFVGCFAFLGFKLPLNVKSIWLSLEQLYMCKCIWVLLPLFFPIFFPSFPFLFFSSRWCHFSVIHANTCFFKRERREKKNERRERRVRENSQCAALYHNPCEHQAGTLWLKFPQNKEKRPCCHDSVYHRPQIKSGSL